ncbi:hypothetical protein AX16_004182 [Volvariella volvacea WC 439]|nr:hypothetical protein AX16_004182 [Volvariella volvacea WC 439]
MPGMWWELERLYKGKNVEIDKTRSFFVGDAAGRKDDFAGTDRKWATNVGLNFYTPEEYFLESPKQSFKMEGFESRILLQNRQFVSPMAALKLMQNRILVSHNPYIFTPPPN